MAMFSDNAAGELRPDGSQNVGTDVTVGYNPNRTMIGDGSEAWHTRPPGVALAHELIHADAGTHGKAVPMSREDVNDAQVDPTTGKAAYASVDELRTVGVSPHAYRFTENMIRAEWDPKQAQRTHY